MRWQPRDCAINKKKKSMPLQSLFPEVFEQALARPALVCRKRLLYDQLCGDDCFYFYVNRKKKKKKKKKH